MFVLIRENMNGYAMIRIDSIEDYLRLFEQPGWEKTSHSNGYDCRLGAGTGNGSVKVYGDPRQFYYIKADFSYSTDTVCLFSVEEPYIEISNNVEDTFLGDDACSRDLIAEHGLNCHVNVGSLRVSQFFPAGTRFWKESLVAREGLLREQIPAGMEEELFDMAGALSSGGIADPRIAVLFKQLGAFPLHADYGSAYLKAKVFEAVALLRDKTATIQWDKATLSPAEVNRLKKAIFFLKEQYDKPLSIAYLTTRFEMNRNKLQAGFRTLTGYAVHEYLLNIRVQEAVSILVSSDTAVPEIARRVGFGTVKSLYDAFSKFLGAPPNYVRKALRMRLA